MNILNTIRKIEVFCESEKGKLFTLLLPSHFGIVYDHREFLYLVQDMAEYGCFKFSKFERPCGDFFYSCWDVNIEKIQEMYEQEKNELFMMEESHRLKEMERKNIEKYGSVFEAEKAERNRMKIEKAKNGFLGGAIGKNYVSVFHQRSEGLAGRVKMKKQYEG